MTHQQYLMDQVNSIQLLLKYIPFCIDVKEKYEIMQEIRRMRRIVMDIEELSKTEKQMQLKMITITVESCF